MCRQLKDVGKTAQIILLQPCLKFINELLLFFSPDCLNDEILNRGFEIVIKDVIRFLGLALKIVLESFTVNPDKINKMHCGHL